MKISEFLQDEQGAFSSKRFIYTVAFVIAEWLMIKIVLAMIEKGSCWTELLYLLAGNGAFILIMSGVITVENIKQMINIAKNNKNDTILKE